MERAISEKNKKTPGVTQYALYFKRIPSNKGFLDLNPIMYEIVFPSYLLGREVRINKCWFIPFILLNMVSIGFENGL